MISEVILSPTLITTIRDTRPGDAWLPLVAELEDKIQAVRVNGRVKAAHEMGMVVEGLKAKVRPIPHTLPLNLTSVPLPGNHLPPPVPTQHAQTHPRKRKNKHSNHPIIHPTQIPPVLPLFAKAGAEDRTGDPEGVRGERAGVL